MFWISVIVVLAAVLTFAWWHDRRRGRARITGSAAQSASQADAVGQSHLHRTQQNTNGLGGGVGVGGP